MAESSYFFKVAKIGVIVMLNILYFDPKYMFGSNFVKRSTVVWKLVPSMDVPTEKCLNTTWGSGGHKIDISNENTKSIFVRSLLLSLYVLL